MIIYNISPCINAVYIAIDMYFAKNSYNLKYRFEEEAALREYPVLPNVVVAPPKILFDSTTLYSSHIRPFAQHIEPFRQQFQVPVQFCMGNFRIDLRSAYVFVT